MTTQRQSSSPDKEDTATQLGRQGRRRPGWTPSKPRGFLRRKQFLIAGLVIVVALGYLGYNAFQGASMYYLTVGELLAKGEAAYGEQLRVSGKAVEGTVQADSGANVLRFSLADGDGATMPVVYEGIVPDAFKEGADVVVEGGLTPPGVFEASSLLVKCPSKYEPEPGD
jgi:cytochrome c-type biogenesis protein CcmE